MWALLFAANWRFALNGTDYWAIDNPPSPLQHYWSLGVEEQFYLLWPVVVLVAILLAGKRRRIRHVLTASGALLLIAASLAWSIQETASSPTVAYFSTLSRGWELGVGALIAILAPTLQHLPHPFRPVLAWAGLAGIAGSAFLINSTSPFPAPWAALPVLSTALVIISGIGRESRHIFPLNNPVATWMGDISYSLYLWHFPIIILFNPLQGDDTSPGYFAFLIGMMLLTSALSFYYVEEPVRRSTFLTGGPRKEPLLHSWNEVSLSLIATMAIASIGFTAHALTPRQLSPERIASAEALIERQRSARQNSMTTASDERGGNVAPDGPVARLQEDINAALAMAEWPQTDPAPTDVAARGVLDVRAQGCGTGEIGEDLCAFDTGAEKTAYVLGDSLGPGLVTMLTSGGSPSYNVRGLTMAGCVTLDLIVKNPGLSSQEDCESFKRAAIEEINRDKPDVVLVVNTFGSMGDIVPGEDGLQGVEAWRAAADRTLSLLEPSGASVVLVTSNPVGRTFTTCVAQGESPIECEGSISDIHEAATQAQAEVAQQRGQRALDTRALFCNAAGACPLVVDGTPVKVDTIHLTQQYAERVAPAFGELLKGALG